MPEEAAVAAPNPTHEPPTRVMLLQLLLDEAQAALFDLNKETNEKVKRLSPAEGEKHAERTLPLRKKVDAIKGQIAAEERMLEKGLSTTKERDDAISPLVREAAKLEGEVQGMDEKFQQEMIRLQSEVNFSLYPRLRAKEAEVKRYAEKLSQAKTAS